MKFNPAHQFTCSWGEGVDTNFLPKYKQRISRQKIYKKVSQKEKKKRSKKERHDDKTSTNGRFKINPIVVILGYLTPLTSSINIKTFITTSKKAFKAPGFAWRVLHHPLDTALPLTQITPNHQDSTFNPAQPHMLCL